MAPRPPLVGPRQDEAIAAADLQRLADLTDDLLCVSSLEGRFLSLNPAWEQVLGHELQELKARPFLEFVHPDDRKATLKVLGGLERGEPVRLFENRYRHADGTYRWLGWSAVPDLDHGIVYAVARDVTDIHETEKQCRWAEQEAARAHSVLESIRHVQRLAIVGAEQSEVFDFLLEQILEVSGSEYGFIGEALSADDERPHLKTQAITNIAWNEETRRFYDEHAPEGLVFENLETLFGRVLTTGQPVIANDPLNDPRSGGLPEGHPPLNAFLGVPLRDGDGMVGMLGVANREGGYDEELVEFLEPLLATTARLVRAYQVRRERASAEEELRRSEERWRRSVELASTPVLVWSQERIIQYANRAAVELLGHSREQLVGMGLDHLLSDTDVCHDEALRRMRQDGWSHRITHVQTAGGELVPVELQAVDLGDGTYQGMAFDMRDWVTIETQLKEASQRDNLTGLLNRKAIEEHAEVEVHRSRRRATSTSLLLLDLDHFKRVNDVHGHLAGDAVIQRAAEILSSNVRPYDWTGRWGGEEFLIVLPEATEEQARLIAERIRTAIAAEPFDVSTVGPVPVTVSIGIYSTSTGSSAGMRQCFERVDQALYRAKELGRNRVVGYRSDPDEDAGTSTVA